jgi:hypothetical protein
MGGSVPESPQSSPADYTGEIGTAACDKGKNNILDVNGGTHSGQNVSPSELSSPDRKRRKTNSPFVQREYGSPTTPSDRSSTVVGKQRNLVDSNTGNNHKKKKASKQQDKEDMLWICAECKEADCGLVTKQQPVIYLNHRNDGDSTPSAPEESFLICDGGCHRIFHVPCADLAKVPETEDVWLCKDCSRKEHACAFCTEYGKDNIDVFQCQDGLCGLFFHESCLQAHRVDYVYDKDDGKAISALQSVSEEDDFEMESAKIPLFTCPAHQCWTCTQKDMIQLEKEEEAAEKRLNGNNSSTKKKGKKKRQSIFQSKTGRLFVSIEMLLLTVCCNAIHIACTLCH